MRNLFVAIVALGMLLTSCAKNDGVVAGEEGIVSFKVSQPNLNTRAAKGGVAAQEQFGTGVAAEDLQYAIFEVKGEAINHLFTRPVVEGFFAEDKLVNTLQERLVNNKTYIGVFWADAEAGTYYDVDLQSGSVAIKNVESLVAQNENLDAFYAVSEPFTVNGQTDVSVTLYRPFAQLNISSCDTTEAEEAGMVVANTGVTVKGVYTDLNLFSGAVSNPVELTFASEAKPSDAIYTISNQNYDLLSFSYLLVNEKTLVDVEFAYSDGQGQDFTREFTSVPVQRNYRTHIIGNLLTDITTFNVVIEPEFIDDYICRDNIADVLTSGGSYTLTEDVVLTEPLIIEDDVESVINLNGHTITYANEDLDAYTAVFMVRKGTLTIEGEGNIVAEGTGNIAVWAGRGDAENDGKIVIKGGNFSNDSSQELIYAINKGTIEIYGGTFQVAEQDTKNFAKAQYPVLNLKSNGKTGCDIVVYGGSFYNFNPADNVSENPKAGYHDSNFVADGYEVEESSDSEGNVIYTVVKAA